MAAALSVPISSPRNNEPANAWSLQVVVCWILVALITFINGADFRGTTGAENFEVHWQIYLRLLLSVGQRRDGCAVDLPLLLPRFFNVARVRCNATVGLVRTLYSIWH